MIKLPVKFRLLPLRGMRNSEVIRGFRSSANLRSDLRIYRTFVQFSKRWPLLMNSSQPIDRHCCIQRAHFAAQSSASSELTILNSLPEYKAGVEKYLKGDFVQALGQYGRAFEVGYTLRFISFTVIKPSVLPQTILAPAITFHCL